MGCGWEVFAGRGWCCAMIWILCLYYYGFNTSAAGFCKFNQTAKRKHMIPFDFIWVYAGTRYV